MGSSIASVPTWPGGDQHGYQMYKFCCSGRFFSNLLHWFIGVSDTHVMLSQSYLWPQRPRGEQPQLLRFTRSDWWNKNRRVMLINKHGGRIVLVIANCVMVLTKLCKVHGSSRSDAWIKTKLKGKVTRLVACYELSAGRTRTVTQFCTHHFFFVCWLYKAEAWVNQSLQTVIRFFFHGLQTHSPSSLKT